MNQQQFSISLLTRRCSPKLIEFQDLVNSFIRSQFCKTFENFSISSQFVLWLNQRNILQKRALFYGAPWIYGSIDQRYMGLILKLSLLFFVFPVQTQLDFYEPWGTTHFRCFIQYTILFLFWTQFSILTKDHKSQVNVCNRSLFTFAG